MITDEGPVLQVPPDPHAKVVRLVPASESERELVPPDAKPVIRVSGGSLSESATAGEAAIIKARKPVYIRSGAGALVRPVVEEVDAAHGRRTKVARLGTIESAHLRDLLCRAAQWERFDRRRNEWVQINPPQDVAVTLLAREGEWKFPSVAGIITCPTLRPDGSVLAKPGYDVATRLILADPPAMPRIPEAPTRTDALQAVDLLEGLLSEFPFVDDASRSVALSALITPVVRGSMPVAPGHAVTAPEAGSGKSFVFDVAASITMGDGCPVISAGKSEEETEKRLGAAVIAGQQIIAIDNVNGELGGDSLCQLIERPVVDVRVLGLSKLVRAESRTTIFLNGNNLVVLADMTRRVLVARLDAGVERPELRQFKGSPVATVLADRGRYVAACLIIVRAYLVAGRPAPAPRLASFEAWSDTVRSALVWLGRANPVSTMERSREADPQRARLRAVLTAWRDAIGAGESAAITAAELIAKTEEYAQPNDGEPYGPRERRLGHPELRAAVAAVAAPRGQLDAVVLGRWLGRNVDRVVNAVRLRRKTDAGGHAATYWLEEKAGEAGKAGSFGPSAQTVTNRT